jgi:2-keto-4-pentenoate hydratase/2-oxohepta-3-ene-1,7-dioic acid hydratase in catechol pathway
VSERDFQLRQGGQWTKGKSADHFAPLGPYLVTKDEIPDPQQLSLWLEVNGELLQNSSTSDLIFDIPTLVSYVSNYMTLLPGDVISTGTPAGVGMGLKEPRYLKSGDRVRLGIEGLGISEQLAVQDPEA